MTRENFEKHFITGSFEIPKVGHYRIEKKDNGFVSYNELDSKNTLTTYNNLDELFSSEINGKLFSEWVNTFEDILVFDDVYDKEAFEKTGKLF